MRILSVGNMYPPHHHGGYELIWESAVEHQRAGGHRVRVLTTDYRRNDPGAPDDDPDVRRDLRWYWRDHEFPPLSARARYAVERHNARVLARELAEVRPDVVAWWAMGGMSLSMVERVRRLGIPAVGVICDDWLIYGPRVDAWTRAFRNHARLAGPAGFLARIPTRVDLAHACHYVFLSDTLRRRARAEWPALDRAEVAHRGADAGLFRPLPEHEWSWRILYAGRIDPRKGIDVAIRALEHLPAEAALTVKGSGDERHLLELRELARQLGLESRVRFLDDSRATLADAYAEADVVAFPVLWDEPWGLVPLEAMAVGTPVVASGKGGSGEYLRDGDNCLVSPPEGGPARLAERIAELAADAGLRRRLRDRGLATARAISAEEFDRSVLAAAERVAAEAARRPGAATRMTA